MLKDIRDMFMIKKLLVGLVVVVTAVGAIKLIPQKDAVAIKDEEVVQNENADVSDSLFEDTFNEDSSIKDESIKEEENKEEIPQKNELDEMVEADMEKYKEEQEANKKQEGSKTVSGVFQGFADGNFVEIQVGGNYDVYMVSPGAKSKLQSKSVGSSVTFTYSTSGGQRVISSVN